MSVAYPIISALCSAILTRWLIRCGGIGQDVPNERSSHVKVIPRGGGLSFLISTPVIIFLATGQDFSLERDLVVTLIGSCLFGLMGFLDDRRGIATGKKFVIGALIALAMAHWGVRWEGVSLGSYQLSLPPGMDYFVTAFWILWVTNLYNMMDGVDGIAALEALVLSLFYLVIGYFTEIPELVLISSVMGAAILGFLPFNFPRARIFMGDTGSLFLGSVFSLLPIYLHSRTGGKFGLWLATLSLAPFFFDACVTALRRFSTLGIEFFKPHRSHFYQRLSDILHSHVKTSLLYTFASMVFCTAVFWEFSQPALFTQLALFVSLLGLFAFFRGISFYWRSRDPKHSN